MILFFYNILFCIVIFYGLNFKKLLKNEQKQAIFYYKLVLFEIIQEY